MEERKADLTSLEGYGTTVAPKYPEKGKGEFTRMYCYLQLQRACLHCRYTGRSTSRVAMVVQGNAALHLNKQGFAAFSPKAAHPQRAAHATPACRSCLPLAWGFCIPRCGVDRHKVTLNVRGSQKEVGPIYYEAWVCSRSSLRAAQLLRVLFLWINFQHYLFWRVLGLFFLDLFFFFPHEFWFPCWRLFTEPVAVQAPVQGEQLATWVLLLYLDFQLFFLILTCRFPGRAANNFFALIFSWPSPLSFCVSFFLCRWH